MRLRTLALFLIGDRQAILDLAADRRALWVGLLFVLSAGFAREYDQKDLLREPWYLLVPLAASLVASFVLFLIACGKLFVGPNPPPFWSAYRSFLTLFWLTAPLAWLYAIPYERFLSPVEATWANLLTLGLVALWRVMLMIRVASVITDRSLAACAGLVFAFANAAAFAALYFMPAPIIAIMGGVNLSEGEAIVNNVSILGWCVSILLVPVSLVLGISAWVAGRPIWQVPPPNVAPPSGRSGWALAVLSLLCWAVVLPWTQSEQHRRTRVEDDMRAGRNAEALDLMSAHQRSDFPPGWDPPPDVNRYEEGAQILDVMDRLVDRNPAPWVRETYLTKFRQYLGEPFVFDNRGIDYAKTASILSKPPEGPELAAKYREVLERRLGQSDLPPEKRSAMETMLKLAKSNNESK